ncbi:MAG: circularly permuted type 2 ATP-grasp protein [Saprospiraceae bacterium]|nr:circularly permuted type 2 ATP-grasp protein [Saprospiraceae bacterium]MBP7922541.1 circularly permuted type 2 ATP-grasp protein [Saprospiraceae bacterium]MBP8095118.1 circularly permuted type 2 ATP-grasp protein [Saprospiraceae bacterium]MBP8941877.1 circularly permuted type 2 ATP-grasp protein [Saprospiraceae bacterium]MBP9745233.1 circularly permuted type 2 ATP-grasp protein [Saprospiraceae bacterium]
MLTDYVANLSTYDEVIDQNGDVKPYWKSYFDKLDLIGLQELGLRNQEIVEKLKENGVTYNVYDAENGMNRPWKLDPIPFLVHQQEWHKIEAAIIQRAHLLDLILKDIYGPQSLVKNSIIPPELVFDNAGYLLPCFNKNAKQSPRLSLYGCDMARGPDHNMWLLDNRTSSPSGTGYTLENRTVISQIFPDIHANTFKQSLAPFFNQLQHSISNFEGPASENAHTVFLTPGPGNETYFEHVYLSTYLGYTLVQGSDLLVRDGYVWLKTIEKLSRVDVIIRRVDDAWCDPLELREDSLLGIPGLLQVVRSGKVSVINPIGAGVLENHGLLAFMENACKHFLNEPLLMNSIATWWCGQEKELDFVVANLHRLIIKKVNRKKGFKSIYGRTLSKDELSKLASMLRQHPTEYVAQEEVSLSTTPSLIDGKIVPRLAALRSYAVFDGQDYKVMQGGLTRSSPVQDKFVISNQLGGLSKDTWVVTDQASSVLDHSVSKTSLIKEQIHALPSRTAENLFWVGRLYERTLAFTNFLRIVIDRLNNANYQSEHQSEYITLILKAVTHLSNTYPGFTDEDSEIQLQPFNEIFSLITDQRRSGSVSYDLRSLIETIHVVSDKWNNDSSRIIALLRDTLQYLLRANPANMNKLTHSLEKLNIRLLAFYGNISSTFLRDHGFYLLETGIYIERIQGLISVIRSSFSFKQSDAAEHELVEVVLENHHLIAHYRNLYKSHLSLSTSLRMILLDSHLPFTLSYQLDMLADCLSKLPKNKDEYGLSKAEKNVLEANTLIKLSDIDLLIQYEEISEYRPALDKLLSKVYSLISAVTNQLTSQYFNHSTFHHTSMESEDISETDAI